MNSNNDPSGSGKYTDVPSPPAPKRFTGPSSIDIPLALSDPDQNFENG